MTFFSKWTNPIFFLKMYDILVFVVNSIGLKILNTSFVYESTKIVFEAVRSASEKLLA